MHNSNNNDEIIAFYRLFPLVPTPTKESVAKAAQWVADALTKAGCDHCEIIPTAGHPIVYAEKIIAPNLPTVLVYGHYDVQPLIH